jgi:hypothetical protein
MGLFSIFTGDTAIDAANQNKAMLQDTQAGIYDRTQKTKNLAGQFLNTGFDAAGNALQTGYGAGTGAINTGAGSALGYLDQGTTGAVGALTANGGAYAPLSALADKYGKGADLYGNALGINGAEGTAAARSAFTASPGYDYTLNQGIDAINRRANAGGMLAGGNANRDAIDYATNLANKDYGSWLDRLGGFNNLQLGATQGAAAGNQGNNAAVANLLNTGGQNKAQVATGQGNSLAELARMYYGGQAGLDTARGAGMAGLETGANSTITGSELNIAPQINKQTTDAAAAELQGSKNILSAGMGLASLAAGGVGGIGGLGSLMGGAGAAGNAVIPSSSFMNNNWGW